jgi:glycosyltransferase involved in cell wall biosynthesis
MYNEEQNALRVVISLHKELRKLTEDYEIIIVESGSTDNTKNIVDDIDRTYEHVMVYHQHAKEGLGSAIRYGFSKCQKELVLYMDGDEPFSIEEVKKAIPLIRNVDAVLGYRLGERESFARWFYSKGYNSMVQTFLGFKVKDVNFSFKLLKQKVIGNMDLRANGFFIDAEIIAELKRNGYRWKEMPVTYTARKGGVSSVRVGPKLMGNMIKEMISYMVR